MLSCQGRGMSPVEFGTGPCTEGQWTQTQSRPEVISVPGDP